VGSEKIGLYSEREVRGCSPITAGNVRIDEVYANTKGGLNSG
jgi:hypothetical protein